MLEFLLRRLARMIPTVFLLSVIVFSMMHMLPGDPVTAMLSEQEATSKEAVERLREQLGLNDPLHVQYWRFVSRAVRGDFGRSIVLSRRPVVPMILEVFPSTVQLTLAAVVFSVLLGIPLGVVAATRQNSVVDNLAMAFSFLGICMPGFWVGLLLIMAFCVRLRWISVTNQEGWQALILPAISLGWGAAGIIARLTRTSLLEVLRLDYMNTARAKGLSELTVVIRHGLRNSLIPVVTVVGLQFGSLLGGAVITETVFGRRGIGRIAVEAVLAQDFPVVQGTVFIAAMSYMFVNLMVDILYLWLDPRIRYD